MDSEDLLEDLESDIEELEHDFQEVKDTEAEGTLREKQKKAEELLEDIHQQLKFLKKVAEKGKE